MKKNNHVADNKNIFKMTTLFLLLFKLVQAIRKTQSKSADL